jgi:sigma-B regulation protein RsbU (phosphoserine phosphatase)
MKKKKKNPYPRSFAGRLTWYIMATLLVVMVFTSYIIYQTSWAILTTETEVVCQELLDSRREKIHCILSDVYVAAVNTVPDIEQSLQRPDRLAAIMERIVKLNPYVNSCGVSFVANYYPQKGRWYCPYAFRRDDGTIGTKTVGSAQKDYLNDEWFVEAVKADSGYWSKPFVDANDSTVMLTSYLAPIHDTQGRIVAVLGVDVSLEWLNKEVQKDIFIQLSHRDNRLDDTPDSTRTYNTESSYFFIIDSDGTYVLHPESKRILKESFFDYARESVDTLDDHLGRLMTAGKVGYYYRDDDDNDLAIEGTNSHVFYTPLKDLNWSMAMVVPSLYINIIGYVVGGFLLFFIFIALLVVFFVGRRAIRRAVKPVKLLAASANEVAQGHFDTPLPRVKRRDEICQLRDSFEQMQLSLKQYVKELQTTTAQKSAIENELKIAHDIQMSMLPKIYPPYPDRHDVDIYGTLTPAKGVGGDLFDFYIRDERLFFCIGDVSGKGIPAALVMAVTRSLFRNISSYVSRPDHIVTALNNALADGNETNMFVTVFVGVLDLAKGHLYYCNGGHESPLLVGRDVGTLPCDSNLAVGIISDFKFTLQEADIDPQTTIFLYTDGLNEAEDARHGQFGEQRIHDVAHRVLANGEQQPLNLIFEMNEAVHRFVAGAEQSDDLTMLAIQYLRN